MAKTDLDFDFGFTAMDADELDAVQDSVLAAQKAQEVSSDVQNKIDALYNMIMPLLNNLQKNPEKEYIYWPNRMDKVEAFRDQLTEVYNS
tara:strand:- start:1848 stop:2117 length:270 start_codon:yes stop_codon:yes gene_type:complete